MKILLLIAVFQAFFFTALLLQKKNKAIHDYMLMGWLIYLGLFIGFYAFYTEDFFLRAPYLVNAYISLLMLHGPFLYFYTRALILPADRPGFKPILLHLLPFLLFNLYLFIAYRLPQTSANIRLDYVDQGLSLPLIYKIFLLTTVLSGPVYILWVFKLLHRHNLNILNNYSFEENINLRWLRNLILVFGVVWISLTVFALIHHLLFLFTRDFCTHGLFLSLAAFVVLAGYFGLKQSVIVPPGNLPDHVPVKYEKIPDEGLTIPPEADQESFRKLEEYMVTAKPYLDAQLTLQQLAERSGILPHHLSRIINDLSHQNFFDYVNSYRVIDVKQKMADPKFGSFSYLGIAFDSGFNSKSAFNRFFKKATGMTPGEYKNSLVTRPTL